MVATPVERLFVQLIQGRGSFAVIMSACSQGLLVCSAVSLLVAVAIPIASGQSSGGELY